MRVNHAPIRFAPWCIAFLVAPVVSRAQIAPVVGRPLPRWQPGTLDIHQISTGRGNAAFVVFPDATTLLVDAGDAGSTFPNARLYPDNTRSAGDWISRYVKRNAPDSSAPIDCALVTHFHIDHIEARRPAWHSIETAIARAAGPVDVRVANHHADDESDSLLDLLGSSVIVILAWAPIHPASSALQRMAATRERAPLLFTTDFRDSTGTLRADSGALAAPPGHVVIRVAPSGRQYWVAVVANRDESGTVIAVKGPLRSNAITPRGTSRNSASQKVRAK